MTTVYKGITVPDLTDPPNSPAQMRALVDSGGAVPRFATLAEANAAFPAGQRPVGMIVSIGGLFYTSNGTDFVTPTQGAVPQFATVADRNTALPNPSVGDVCVVRDFPWSTLVFGPYLSLGNRWIGIMSHIIVVTTNASGSAIVNFPTKPSGGAPFISSATISGFCDTTSDANTLVLYGCMTGYPNAAGFQFVARNLQASGSVRANATCRFGYVVVGSV